LLPTHSSESLDPLGVAVPTNSTEAAAADAAADSIASKAADSGAIKADNPGACSTPPRNASPASATTKTNGSDVSDSPGAAERSNGNQTTDSSPASKSWFEMLCCGPREHVGLARGAPTPYNRPVIDPDMQW